MAFPRAKANCYEYGIHMPLAIAWPARVPGARVVDDVVDVCGRVVLEADDGGSVHADSVCLEIAHERHHVGPLQLLEAAAGRLQAEQDPRYAKLHGLTDVVLADGVG